MPEPFEPGFLLDWVRDLGSSETLYDFHVHPFDVLTGDSNYLPSQASLGLYSKSSSTYHPPSLGTGLESSGNRLSAGANSLSAFLLASRITYTHTGAKVITDHLDLAGLAKALLLPVARTPGIAENMLDASDQMFQDDRLLHGCAFPVGKSPDDILEFLRSAQEKRKIFAVKLHLNLVGLNPLDDKSRELIEATLVAAGSLNLIVVVHGGRTPSIEPVDSRENGILPRLVRINWSLSSSPVILAHAGCYGLTEEEAISNLPILNDLFDKYHNLMADTSNLESNALKHVLEKVDRNRLIFGSDALYIPIWKAWLRFVNVLRQVSSKPEDDLVRIASLNPRRCLDSIRMANPFLLTPSNT